MFLNKYFNIKFCLQKNIEMTPLNTINDYPEVTDAQRRPYDHTGYRDDGQKQSQVVRAVVEKMRNYSGGRLVVDRRAVQWPLDGAFRRWSFKTRQWPTVRGPES